MSDALDLSRLSQKRSMTATEVLAQAASTGCALTAIHVAHGSWEFGWWMVLPYTLIIAALTFANGVGRLRDKRHA